MEFRGELGTYWDLDKVLTRKPDREILREIRDVLGEKVLTKKLDGEICMEFGDVLGLSLG